MKHTRLTENDLIERDKIKSIIDDGRFRIAIFGSARIQPQDQAYQDIADFSMKLALKDYDIVTGGGPGAMEAASKGHHIACEDKDTSQSIGINIELPTEQKPNAFLDISGSAHTFSMRLDTFMLLSHVFVITPGGVGTMLEFFYTWQLMQVGHICKAPIILIGKEFKLLKEYIQTSMVEKGFITAGEAELAIQVDTYEEAHKLIDEAYKAYEALGPNACVNIRQYLAGARSLGLID